MTPKESKVIQSLGIYDLNTNLSIKIVDLNQHDGKAILIQEDGRQFCIMSDRWNEIVSDFKQ